MPAQQGLHTNHASVSYRDLRLIEQVQFVVFYCPLQGIALGQALAPKPTLVLLDEPFNALVLDLRRSMCEDVISLLRKTGTTAILVSHDPGEAFAVSDQLAVMLGGKIMQCAAAEQIYWQPNSETVARLTGDAILLPGEYAEDGVQTNLGLIELYPDSPRAAFGQPATLMIRPEQFHWCQSGQGVPARVTKRSFRGDHSMLEVEITSMCLNLRMPSLMAPALGSEGHLRIRGACMAYPG